MLTPEYKGYKGVFEYEPKSESFFGNVVDTTLITFKGDTPREAIRDFYRVVDLIIEAKVQVLEPEKIKSVVNEIRARLEGVTKGPWRWADWDTNFGQRESEDLDDRLTLEYSKSRGASMSAEVHESEDHPKCILTLLDPVNNQRDAYFIASARTDIETLLFIVEGLLEKET